MAGLLTPPRRYGRELLDSNNDDAELVLRTVEDIRRSNVVFGGTRAALAELVPHFKQLSRNATLLDVGTGLGDVPCAAARAARMENIALTTIGVDASCVLATTSRNAVTLAVCASGLQLPFGDASVDIVMCSQTLHHFRGEDEMALLREMNRVARVAVIISDLRRSWVAAAGFWLASFPLGFHGVTRHDGVLSVMRGYTTAELSHTIYEAVGVAPAVTKRTGFRVTTSWSPAARQSA
jgi:ubiquinone/menaquinone biosynthesis C-methylase UbiE